MSNLASWHEVHAKNYCYNFDGLIDRIFHTTFLLDQLLVSFAQKPFFTKLSEECGGCWYTNDNGFEKESTGLLVDNTRYTQGLPGPRSVPTKVFSQLKLE